ncbi:uncharacterized protein LOC131157028 [Malania oleifera]|uniref:uncharacterized protein LOC131157028 n=1 Tax=Malania oleifera TaxID=397392 RepID=UPI0025AE732F|nr:uncharacterized protein LOC131157028 [Malania oleifera]
MQPAPHHLQLSDHRFHTEREMGAAQAMKRIPRIKFPQRHPKPSVSGAQTQPASAAGDVNQTSFSRASNMTVGGKASLQPKRTPVSDKEIEAILLGGCC